MPVSQLFSLLAFVAVPLVLLSAYLWRQKDVQGPLWWAVSWEMLWISGVGAAWGTTPGLAVMRLAGTLFCYFLFRGALEFSGRREPRWVYPAALLSGLLSSALTLADQLQVAQWVATVSDMSMLLAAGLAVMLRQRNFSGWMFGSTLLLLSSLNLYEQRVQSGGGSVDLFLILLWVTGGFGLGLSELMCLEARRHEIVARVRAELGRERREAELDRAVLQAAIETSPVGYCITGPDGTVLHLSSPWGETPRLDGAAWVGQPIARLVAFVRRHLDVPDELTGLLYELEGGDSGARGVVRRNLDLTFELRGETVNMVLFTSPILDPEGTFLGTLIVGRDSTEERALELSLRQAQKMETLGRLAGGMAHDFNNQLAAISGNVELAELATEEERQNLLRGVRRSIDHCATMTRGLLSFASRTPVRVAAIDANALVVETMQLLKPMMPSSVAMEVEPARGDPAVRADPTHLQQILMNLCINARDAIASREDKTDGLIRVRVSKSGDRGPVLADGHPRDHLCFEVSDTGIGIPRTQLARVFEPFFTTKGLHSGTGLGLSVVHGLVQGLDGRIELDSEEGVGTTFKILLPMALEEVEAPRSGVLVLAPEGHERILVVDDEDAVRKVVAMTLERKGYQILCAASGDEAIELFERQPGLIQAVVSDLSMPGQDGRAAAEAMRELCPGLPVILMSGHYDRESGASDCDFYYLPKPFRASDLLDLVRHALDARDEVESLVNKSAS